MIEVENVQPTAREYRALRRGWGALHWVAVLPLATFQFGFLIFGILALGPHEARYPPLLLFVSFFVTWLVWMIANWMQLKVTVKALDDSPVGGLSWRWQIDAEGIIVSNALQTSTLDWRGVKAVVEEKDRFLFLVTPSSNPVLPTRLMTEAQRTELRALVAEVKASGRLGAGAQAAA